MINEKYYFPFIWLLEKTLQLTRISDLIFFNHDVSYGSVCSTSIANIIQVKFKKIIIKYCFYLYGLS